jgi:hypothetical protein
MRLVVFLRLDVFFRLLVEIFFTTRGTEIISLPLIFRFVGRSLGVDIHATYRIFYHFDLLSRAIGISILYTFFYSGNRPQY